MDATSHFEQRADPPVNLTGTGRLEDHLIDDLEERGLPGTVQPDQRYGVAGLDVQVDIPEDPAPARTFAPKPLPESDELVVELRMRTIGTKSLPDPIDPDRALRQCRQA